MASSVLRLQWRESNAKNRKRLQNEVFDLYGRKCAMCGLEDVRVLDIDHINGGGTQHRKKLNYSMMRRYVLLHPSEFRLLCKNCNWIAHLENRGE